MKKWKITPIRTTGRSSAPSMIIEAEDREKAVEEAKKRSPLLSYPQWTFSSKEIKSNK